MDSCDAGSLPFTESRANRDKFLLGAVDYRLHSDKDLSDAGRYFEKKVVASFIHKAQMGIDIPYYPQFREMNHMFLSVFPDLEKLGERYVEARGKSSETDVQLIPEVKAIRENSKRISEELHRPFELGVCITGPYTLSSYLAVKNTTVFLRLANTIGQLFKANIFSDKHARVSMVSIDEPYFGTQDDPLVDPTSDGRENLRSAWQLIGNASKFYSRSVKTCMHLHNTADKLFWEVESLDAVESEVNNSLYQSKETKRFLEVHDKLLKANVCRTNFDDLILEKLATQKGQKTEGNQEIVDIWRKIKAGKLDPTIFLEDTALIRKRITNLISKYGAERILCAAPECGLKGFPTYKSALECLKRVATAARSIKPEIRG